MIIKNYEISKINFNLNKLILFYGKNEGHKNENLKLITKDKKNISIFEEKEILENKNSLIEDILSRSFFDNEKIIIIKRVTDKIINVIEELKEKNIDDVIIILNSENLEKKSKLRSLFEKDKNLICMAYYPDNEKTLFSITNNFFKKKKISISPININLIVNKCGGDRGVLFNELNKIEHFSKKKEKITTEELLKLINLVENHSISSLIDNCLAKNKKKIINILNENNFSNDETILITKIFLNKLKKILTLTKEYENNKNINLTISSAKPPIFWKDKEIVKEQLKKWNSQNIKKLIYELNELELSLKKNINNSVNLVTDFILEKVS